MGYLCQVSLVSTLTSFVYKVDVICNVNLCYEHNDAFDKNVYDSRWFSNVVHLLILKLIFIDRVVAKIRKGNSLHKPFGISQQLAGLGIRLQTIEQVVVFIAMFKTFLCDFL